MIDSVLKGTGNSRFLKSAVPAGTSWADALAMLQAGTFPIDFNGINTEGFQQVGTPLNKANLLKDATAAQIGLPPSTTPDGMFQALGNTGELHVWRKTVVTTEPIPEQSAGYNLGSKTNFLIGTPSRSSREPYINVMYANAVSVSNDGTVNISGDSSSISGWYPSNGDSPNYLQMRGKFIKITQFAYLGAPRTVDMDTVYYIPNDATATLPTYGSANGEFRIEMQKVIGYPYTPEIPAGTTTTYPVSTNPNAYQEGDDAKAAGYVVGEAVSGSYYLGNANVGYAMNYKTATLLSVSDDGVLSMPTDATQIHVEYSKNGLTTDQIKSYFAGKFVQLVSVGSDSVFSPSSLFKTAPSEILFIPSDSAVTKDNFKNFNIDRYQPVTSYAAIPAGTTIEYLGKLGDKARVQVLSYVGTGTYGSSNPNSLTFDFVAKFIMELGSSSGKEGIYFSSEGGVATIPNFLDNDYRSRCGFGDLAYSWCKKSVDGKTITWYSTRDQYKQNNSSGVTYYYVAIG